MAEVCTWIHSPLSTLPDCQQATQTDRGHTERQYIQTGDVPGSILPFRCCQTANKPLINIHTWDTQTDRGHTDRQGTHRQTGDVPGSILPFRRCQTANKPPINRQTWDTHTDGGRTWIHSPLSSLPDCQQATDKQLGPQRSHVVSGALFNLA
jgi:hypothetical protein